MLSIQIKILFRALCELIMEIRLIPSNRILTLTQSIPINIRMYIMLHPHTLWCKPRITIIITLRRLRWQQVVLSLRLPWPQHHQPITCHWIISPIISRTRHNHTMPTPMPIPTPIAVIVVMLTLIILLITISHPMVCRLFTQVCPRLIFNLLIQILLRPSPCLLLLSCHQISTTLSTKVITT